MQILKKEELKRKYSLGKKESPFVSHLVKLHINEGLLITREEWKLKTTPVQYVHANKYNPRSRLYGINLIGETVENGWVIKRI